MLMGGFVNKQINVFMIRKDGMEYNYIYCITKSPSHYIRVRGYTYLKQIVLLQEGPPWQNTN
jgi:hypothetical protein